MSYHFPFNLLQQVRGENITLNFRKVNHPNWLHNIYLKYKFSLPYTALFVFFGACLSACLFGACHGVISTIIDYAMKGYSGFNIPLLILYFLEGTFIGIMFLMIIRNFSRAEVENIAAGWLLLSYVLTQILTSMDIEVYTGAETFTSEFIMLTGALWFFEVSTTMMLLIVIGYPVLMYLFLEPVKYRKQLSVLQEVDFRTSSLTMDSLKTIVTAFVVWLSSLTALTLPFGDSTGYIALINSYIVALLAYLSLYRGILLTSYEQRCRIHFGSSVTLVLILLVNYYSFKYATEYAWPLMRSSYILQEHGTDAYTQSLYNLYLMLQATAIILFFPCRDALIDRLSEIRRLIPCK